MEGTHPFYPERKIGPAPISPPIVEHHHSEARSITGGFVYHGKRLPELDNHYLYCCYQTGTVWGFRYENGQVLDHRFWPIPLTTARLGDAITPTSCIWSRSSGEIFQLDRNPTTKETASQFPALLSQTGIFESVPEQKPAAGVIPYAVNAPGWHDGAGITRLLGVPNDDTINPTVAHGWEFMDGAVAGADAVTRNGTRTIRPAASMIETRADDPPGGRVVRLLLRMER